MACCQHAQVAGTWLNARSTCAKVCLGVIAGYTLLVCLLNYGFLVVLPLVLAPPAAIAWVYARKLRPGAGEADTSQLDDAFIIAGFAACLPVTLLAVLVEMVLSIVGVLIFLRSEIGQFVKLMQQDGMTPEDAISQVNVGVGFWFLLLFTAYVSAGLVEEVAKALVVRRRCCVCGGGMQEAMLPLTDARKRAYITLALFVAAALGFSFGENINYITQAPGDEAPSPAVLIGTQALVAVSRGLISMPLHVVCAAYTAVRLTLRDAQRSYNALLARAREQRSAAATGIPAGATATMVVDMPAAVAAAIPADTPVWSWPRVMWPAILLHGTFDFVLMSLSSASALGQLDPIAEVVLGLLCAIAAVSISSWILVRQFKGVFRSLDAGIVPAGMTMGVHWTLYGADVAPFAGPLPSPAPAPPPAGVARSDDAAPGDAEAAHVHGPESAPLLTADAGATVQMAPLREGDPQA